MPKEWGHTVTALPGTGVAHHTRRHTPMLSTQWDFVTSYVRARFGDTERGASLVEYALLVALIAVVVITVVTNIGTAANTKLSSAASSLAS